MSNQQYAANKYTCLYTGLETCIEGFLSDRRDEDPPLPKMKLGVLVERAGAAIQRIVSDFAEADQWLYFRVSADLGAGGRVVTHEIAPMLRQLKSNHPIKGWWWLYKTDARGPAVRLRVFVPSDASRELEMAVGREFSKLGRDFKVLCYEPELCLFGGADGIRAAHEYFCADSEFLGAWAGEREPSQGAIIPEGLSLALILRLLHACGLDLFECWDVFDRLCERRRIGHAGDKRFVRYQEVAKKVIQSG